MAYDQRVHFADPHHPLQNMQYSHSQIGHCSICLLKLAGFSGYGCYSCNIHLHTACSGYFKETISFFAHPSHNLKLSRSPGRICDICRGDCPEGSFVYNCINCGFDVHPLCSMLPETVAVASPFDPKHEDHLCMFSSESPGNCSACRHALPRWHYTNSSLKLHVTCAVDMTTTGAGGLGSNGHSAIQSSYGYGYDGAVQGSHGTVGQRSLFDARAPAGQMSNYSGYYGYGGGPVALAPAAGYYNHGIMQGYGHAGQAVSYNYNCVPPIQVAGWGGYGPPPTYGVAYPSMPGNGAISSSTGQQQSIFNNPSNMMGAIARFLVGAAMSAVASDMFAQFLSSGFN